MIAIRRARLADAELLAAFGEKTFRDTYAAQNTPEDMDLYVSANFTSAALAKDLADLATTYLLGTIDGALAGYGKLHRGEAPPCVTRPAPIELARLYVEKSHHGEGAALVLLNACLVEAKRQGAKTVWLCVWEKNGRARAFYAKHGFEPVGTFEFVLGRDRQTDHVLVKAC